MKPVIQVMLVAAAVSPQVIQVTSVAAAGPQVIQVTSVAAAAGPQVTLLAPAAQLVKNSVLVTQVMIQMMMRNRHTATVMELTKAR